jgi:methionyl-tRNA formyltransferase
VYDPYIRSETLVDVLKKNILEKNEFKKQKPSEGNTYYIIHPVLKHIALLCCQKK